MLHASSVAALFWTCVLVSPPQDRAAAPPARTRTVVMRVVDGNGKALAGAGLAVGTADAPLTSDALERPVARSAEDGTLRTKITLPARNTFPGLLVAATGRIAMSLAYHPSLQAQDADGEIDLGDVALFEAVTLRGRSSDGAGQPLAGVLVVAVDRLRGSTEPGGAASYLTARSAALSDAKGNFALPCVPDRGLELTFTKDGHFQRRVFPVGRETPLVLELRESGFIEGKVQDAEGRGIETGLSLSYECGASGGVRTDADGKFRATVLQPGRYRLRCTPPAGSGLPTLLSAVLEGPQKGLELRPAAADGVRVVVRAVREPDGKELAEFKAAGFWDNRTQVLPGELLMHGSQKLERSGADRRVTLVPQGSQRGGHVVVTATGMAPAAVRVELEDQDRPKEITVTLGPEAGLEGKVVGEDGKGIAGARVWAVSVREGSSMSYGMIPADAVVTGPDGAFRIGGLAAGNHSVQALHAERLLPDPVRVELAAGKTKGDVTIRMTRGPTLGGRLTGKGAERAYALRLEDPAAYRGFSVTPGTARFSQGMQPLTRRIAPDGAFRFDQLEPKTWRAVLLLPTGSRLSRFVELPLGEVGIGKDTSQDFDTGACVAGRVKGAIDLAAAAGIPGDRLVVLAVPHIERMTPEALALRQKYVVAVPDASGQWALDLAPGSYDLSLHDLGGGATLLEVEEPVEVAAGRDTPAKLAPRLTGVRIKLAPQTKDAPLRASALQVTPRDTRPPNPFGSIARQMLFSNREIGLEPGQGELELWLPAGDFTVKVTSRAGYLAPGSSFRESELATEAITVPEKGPHEVTVRVTAPPATAELER